MNTDALGIPGRQGLSAIVLWRVALLKEVGKHPVVAVVRRWVEAMSTSKREGASLTCIGLLGDLLLAICHKKELESIRDSGVVSFASRSSHGKQWKGMILGECNVLTMMYVDEYAQ